MKLSSFQFLSNNILGGDKDFQETKRERAVPRESIKNNHRNSSIITPTSLGLIIPLSRNVIVKSSRCQLHQPAQLIKIIQQNKLSQTWEELKTENSSIAEHSGTAKEDIQIAILSFERG